MKIETLKQIIKKNSLNEQFAIITNLSNGSSEIFKIKSKSFGVKSKNTSLESEISILSLIPFFLNKIE